MRERREARKEGAGGKMREKRGSREGTYNSMTFQNGFEKWTLRCERGSLGCGKNVDFKGIYV